MYLEETTTPHDFGAMGDGVSNDSVAISRACQSFEPCGGELVLMDREYAMGDNALYLTYPISIRGEGASSSALNPSFLSPSNNAIALNFSPTVAATLTSYSGFAIHNPVTGRHAGNHGFCARTETAGQNLAKLTIKDVIVGRGTGANSRAVHHVNNVTANVNGGMYGAFFQNNVFVGGIMLEGSGDSNAIQNNIITGDGLGVHVSLVAGASLTEIIGNNITTQRGAIRIDAGSRSRIIGNNIENLAAGAAAYNDSAVINITGSNGTVYGGVISENLVSAFGAADATTLIKVANTRGLVIENNTLLTGAAGVTTGIHIAADCMDTRVGANGFSAGMAIRVVDNGIGTMGVVKTPALQNGWVAFLSSHATFSVIKSIDGIVHVYGTIKAGITANGTTVTLLPRGFRPVSILRVPIMVVNAGMPQLAEMTVTPEGDVAINFVLSSDRVEFNFSFPAANLANSISLE